jgi:hypothetical protein
MAVLPEVVVVLVMFALAFGMAAVPVFRSPNHGRRRPLRHLLPDPSQPSSMLSFAALPSLLLLLTLARFGAFFSVDDPVNSPDSGSRLFDAPADVDVGLVAEGRNGAHHFSYPRNTADLTVSAARRFESSPRQERIQAVRDLAWWAGVCPNYVPFVVPRLARALRDPDPGVKGAAAIGLGSTGGHGTVAIPDLLAARGTTVRYFDHLVDEAVFLIEHSHRWPPANECENVTMQELEHRAAQQGDAADGRRDGNERRAARS